MIIQRVAAAVKNHYWSLFLLEVLVVVVGLFIGLQVDDWNESRKDRQREELYLARIYDELAADIENINYGIEIAEHRRDMGQLLIAALADPELAVQDPFAFFSAIEEAAYTFQPLINDFSFQELQFAGEFGIIRDVALRQALTEYYNKIDNEDQWTYLRVHAQNAYNDGKIQVLTLDQQARVVTQDPDAKFTPQETVETLERMRTHPEFVAEIFRASNHYDAIWTYVKWRDAAVQLRDRIGRARDGGQG
jgi:hypothetical protein